MATKEQHEGWMAMETIDDTVAYQKLGVPGNIDDPRKMLVYRGGGSSAYVWHTVATQPRAEVRTTVYEGEFGSCEGQQSTFLASLQALPHDQGPGETIAIAQVEACFGSVEHQRASQLDWRGLATPHTTYQLDWNSVCSTLCVCVFVQHGDASRTHDYCKLLEPPTLMTARVATFVSTKLQPLQHRPLWLTSMNFSIWTLTDMARWTCTVSFHHTWPHRSDTAVRHVWHRGNRCPVRSRPRSV